MTLPAPPQLLLLAVGGLIAGLWLLWRGIEARGAGIRVADTATSRIASLAAGEIRVTGRVEPAEVTLVSPLQSAPCVWYRARVRRLSGEDERTELEEERAVGFRVRDESGSIRVFPRGARFDVPTRFDARTGVMGDEPVELRPRTGGAYAAPPEQDREAAIAALLTVRPAPSPGDLGGLGVTGGGRRRYEEARLEPGDVVTVVGTALPFGHLPDPTGADAMTGFDARVGPLDEETAANLAAARASGLLVSREEAWGNAAIPGFGIGRPVSAPELDPAATAPPLATPEERERIERTFDLTPDRLVIAVDHGSPLLVAAGAPGDVVARHDARFLAGLLGAMLAVGSAVALAVLLSGSLRP